MATWSYRNTENWLEVAERALANPDMYEMADALVQGKTHPIKDLIDLARTGSNVERAPFPYDETTQEYHAYSLLMDRAHGARQRYKAEEPFRGFMGKVLLMNHAIREALQLERFRGAGYIVLDEELADKLLDATEKLVNLWRPLLPGLRAAEEAGANQYETFTWKGVKFVNEGWPEGHVRQLLDKIEWLLDLFKRRGAPDLLQKGLTKVVLELKVDGVPANVAGQYFTSLKEIRMYPVSLEGQARMLDHWLTEVFLHEFGHHIHLNLLPRAAKEFWDSGWEYVDRALEQTSVVTVQERQEFNRLLEQAHYDIAKVGKKVKGVKRLKFLGYLNNIGWVESKKQLRLSPLGRNRSAFLRALQEINSEDYEQYKDRFLDLYSSNVDRLPRELIERVRQKDRSVDEALDALGIPTGYGRTNVKEDFAETFVEFMVHPERLSGPARWRMGRTLGLSDAHGQRIIKLTRAAALVRRFLQDA